MCAKQTNWYLRKPDGSEYGPVTTSELLRWATQSRIVAGNGVSADRETWGKVEDIPELEMDWVAQRPDGREYGPFNIGATRELFEHDVLPGEAILTHRSTLKSVTVEQVLNEEDLFAEVESPAEADQPATSDKQAEIEEEAAEETIQETVEAAPEEAPEEVVKEERASDRPAPAETDAEREARQAQVEKLQAKLDKARAELREARKELSDGLAEAEKTGAALTTERDEAKQALTDLQHKMSALQETFDETEAARRQAETKLARLDAEREEAEEQAIQSTAELRKQTAFMKKNIATLQSELTAMRNKAAARGRALAIILTVLFLAGSAFLLVGLPSCEDEQPGPRSQSSAFTPSTSPAPSPAPSTPSTPQPAFAKATEGKPTSNAKRPTADPQLSTPHSLTTPAPWPRIMVEGVKVTPEAHVFTMRFDSGVFTSLTTPSTAAITQLKAIADTLRPQMEAFQLIVEGHTDDKPLKPTASYDGNYALGLARAEAIRKLLITSGGLPGNSVRAVSAGERNAPYPNDTDANRKRNRTVVLKLVRK